MTRKKIEDIIVRRAKIKDIDDLRILYIEFMKYHGRIDPLLKITSKPDEEAAKYLRKTIYGRDTILLVAERSGRIVGLLGAGVSKIPPIYRYRDFGVIFDLFVSGTTSQARHSQANGPDCIGLVQRKRSQKNRSGDERRQ